MKLAENCFNPKINHIHFHSDCLIFEFEKYKGHQKGEKSLGPWYVYASPSKIWLCPVLSLLQYLICYPDVFNGYATRFEVR